MTEQLPGSGGMGEDLVKQAGEAAAKAARALVTAGKAAILGLIALALGIAATVAAAVAVVGTVMGKILTHLAHSLREAIPQLVAAVPAMAEAVFAGLALLAGVWSGLMFWQAFGVLGPLSLSGVGLAGVLGLAPLLLLYAPNRTAGTAALAMGVSLIGGLVVGRIPLLLLVGVLGGLYLWLVLRLWNRGANPAEERGASPESEGETHGEQDAWDHHDPTAGDVDFVLGGDEHRLYEVDLTRYAG